MKKAMRKLVSVCLSLVLLLSIMPMAAFADDAVVTSLCSNGDHIYAVEGIPIYIDKDAYHRVEVYDACEVCGYRRSPEPIETYNEVHDNVEICLGLDSEVGLMKYLIYCETCGHTEEEYK